MIKITLNTSIPENRRPLAERVIRRSAPGAEITWLPSRFPHLVMFLEPIQKRPTEPGSGSIFESQSEQADEGITTAFLEERLRAALAAEAGQ